MFEQFFTLYWLAQAVGVLALVIILWAFQSKERVDVLKRQTLGVFFFIIHFFLLGAFTGSAMHFISIARNYVFWKKDTHAWARHDAWLYLFLAILLIATLILWEAWYSIFPMLAVMIGTCASWVSNPTKLRALSLVSAATWIPYTIFVESYPALITQILHMGSWIIAIWRHDRFIYKEKYVKESPRREAEVVE